MLETGSGKGVGQAKVRNIDMLGRGGFRKVFKHFANRCLGKKEEEIFDIQWFGVPPTASLRSVLTKNGHCESNMTLRGGRLKRTSKISKTKSTKSGKMIPK